MLNIYDTYRKHQAFNSLGPFFIKTVDRNMVNIP